MPENLAKILVPIAFISFCLFVLYQGVSSPTTLNGWIYLAGALFLEVLALALWDFRRRFLPLLLLVFLAAGTSSPLARVATSARWVVLGVGALVGVVIYLKDRDHFFGAYHLVALLCVIAAAVSTMVSSRPTVAALKSASLLLAFLYGASGARIAVKGREAQFISGAVLACELTVYFAAISYFAFHYPIFGNPNSLGAVTGVGATPFLLWSVTTTEQPSLRRRRTFALCLCIFLLLSSYARAAIVGAFISSLLFCLATRHYRLLMKGVGLALLSAVVVVALFPVKADQSESFVSAFLYKGHESAGVLGSRRTPWEQTSAVIEQHPWFGAGFGTSVTSVNSSEVGMFATTAVTAREHGNSYLEILEWVGLLGVVPFAALVLFTALNAGRVILWLQRTGNHFSPAVPIALVLITGMIHAIFEDWLFAMGYYMCIVFWAMAFVLVDVMRGLEARSVVSVARVPVQSWSGPYGMARPNP